MKITETILEAQEIGSLLVFELGGVYVKIGPRDWTDYTHPGPNYFNELASALESGNTGGFGYWIY